MEPPEIGAPAENDKATASSQESSAPSVAAPTRPLDLPILPGVNKGFNIEVDSTEDNETASPPAQIINKNDGKSELHLQEQNWQAAAEIARQRADEKNHVNNDNGHAPLAVRMSFLPNPKVVPIPSPERKTRPRLVEIPAAAPKPAEPVKAQQSPAECAAIDSYKKKQLEALQSDRQTLKALQSAITDLGLQKQLDFMTGAQQSPVSVTPSQAQPAGAPTGTP
jgi:hypothetical protein